MTTLLLAIGYAIGVWWGGTLVVLLLSRLRGPARGLAIVGTSGAAIGALAVLPFLRPLDDVTGVLLGFGAAVVVWGWLELLLLQGVAVGTRRAPSAPGLKGLARFREAFDAIRHHEFALAGILVLVGVLSLGSALPVAFVTFALLWGLRLSTKLHLFLGVPQPNGHLFPEGAAHLAAFLGPARRSPQLGLTTCVWALATIALFSAGMMAPSSANATAWFLAGTLTGLGTLEHLTLLLPLRLESLWGWEKQRLPSKGQPIQG